MRLHQKQQQRNNKKRTYHAKSLTHYADGGDDDAVNDVYVDARVAHQWSPLMTPLNHLDCMDAIGMTRAL